MRLVQIRAGTFYVLDVMRFLRMSGEDRVQIRAGTFYVLDFSRRDLERLVEMRYKYVRERFTFSTASTCCDGIASSRYKYVRERFTFSTTVTFKKGHDQGSMYKYVRERFTFSTIQGVMADLDERLGTNTCGNVLRSRRLAANLGCPAATLSYKYVRERFTFSTMTSSAKRRAISPVYEYVRGRLATTTW